MTERTFWRERSSTEGLEPRTLIRVFTGPGTLDERIAFYEELQGVRADAVFPYPEVGLALAMVGSFLLIEGADAALEPFRATTGTVLVDEIGPYYERLVHAGAHIVAEPQEVPTGAGFTADHPDGTRVEYVHHRPTPEESNA